MISLLPAIISPVECKYILSDLLEYTKDWTEPHGDIPPELDWILSVIRLQIPAASTLLKQSTHISRPGHHLGWHRDDQFEHDSIYFIRVFFYPQPMLVRKGSLILNLFPDQEPTPERNISLKLPAGSAVILPRITPPHCTSRNNSTNTRFMLRWHLRV